MDKNSKRAKLIFFYSVIFLLLVAVLVWQQVYTIYGDDGQVKVWFLDVGQGDSILVDFGGDNQALIDGGPSKSVLSQIGTKMPYYDRKIEYMILTHPDADHLRGLNYVLDNYDVGKLYWTGANHKTKLYQNFKEKVKQKNIKTEIINFGDVINQDLAQIRFISPTESILGKDFSNLNNSSAVAILDIGEVEILLTGDGEEELWQEIGNKLPKVEILKVSHHGAKNGTSDYLLDMVDPEVGIISVGEGNSYGHPSQSVLEILDRYQIDTYRTDQLGTIELTSDGEQYWVD